MNRTSCYKLLLSHLGLFSVLAVTAPAVAADWTYRTKTDSFDNIETSTAVLQSAKVGETIQITQRGTNAPTLVFSGGYFECFPDCIVQIKFDNSPPELFKAKGYRLLSASITIDDYDRFSKLNANTKTLTLRAVRWRATSDLVFTIDSAFDPGRWVEARKRQAIEKACEATAISEDFTTCMTRKGGATAP